MALKVNLPSNPTGDTPVGADDYQAGQIAALDSSGNAVLCGGEATAGTNGTKNIPVGIFGDDHITSTLQKTSQALEEIVLASGVAVSLAHDAVQAGSVRVIKKVGGTALTVTTDYTESDSAGTITSTGTQPDGTVVQVSYTFSLNDVAEKQFRGQNYKLTLDDTEGSGKSTVWKGLCEVETDQFVTSRAYAIGDLLRPTHSSHAMGAGLLTNEAAGGTVVSMNVGRVKTVPTAANPFLGVTWQGPDATDTP